MFPRIAPNSTNRVPITIASIHPTTLPPRATSNVDPEKHKRLLSRRNQKRHREKAKAYEESLERGIYTLRNNIRALQRHNLLQEKINTLVTINVKSAQLHILSEMYENLFPLHGQFYPKYLENYFAPNVALSDRIQGKAHYFLQIKLYQELFQYTRIHVKSVSSVATDTYIVHSTLSLTITETSIQYIFPQLQYQPDIYQHILGRRLHLPLEQSYYFQGDTIIRVQMKADYIQAWLEILPNIHHAHFIHKYANIDDDYFLRVPTNLL